MPRCIKYCGAIGNHSLISRDQRGRGSVEDILSVANRLPPMALDATGAKSIGRSACEQIRQVIADAGATQGRRSRQRRRIARPRHASVRFDDRCCWPARFGFSGQVAGRDATRADRREGSEPVGPVAGDRISAVFGFDSGVRGFFDSTPNTAPKKKGLFEIPFMD